MYLLINLSIYLSVYLHFYLHIHVCLSFYLYVFCMIMFDVLSICLVIYSSIPLPRHAFLPITLSLSASPISPLPSPALHPPSASILTLGSPEAGGGNPPGRGDGQHCHQENLLPAYPLASPRSRSLGRSVLHFASVRDSAVSRAVFEAPDSYFETLT